MLQPNFDYAAKWVCQRQKIAMQQPVPEPEIAQALWALRDLAGQCRAAVMIPDLFPGTTLETIYLPSEAGTDLAPSDGSKFVEGSRVTVPALSAIGAALIAELENTGNDMVIYDLEEGAQAIAYLPEVRNAVLQSTGLVLLND